MEKKSRVHGKKFSCTGIKTVIPLLSLWRFAAAAGVTGRPSAFEGFHSAKTGVAPGRSWARAGRGGDGRGVSREADRRDAGRGCRGAGADRGTRGSGVVPACSGGDRGRGC